MLPLSQICRHKQLSCACRGRRWALESEPARLPRWHFSAAHAWACLGALPALSHAPIGFCAAGLHSRPTRNSGIWLPCNKRLQGSNCRSKITSAAMHAQTVAARAVAVPSASFRAAQHAPKARCLPARPPAPAACRTAMCLPSGHMQSMDGCRRRRRLIPWPTCQFPLELAVAFVVLLLRHVFAVLTDALLHPLVQPTSGLTPASRAAKPQQHTARRQPQAARRCVVAAAAAPAAPGVAVREEKLEGFATRLHVTVPTQQCKQASHPNLLCRELSPVAPYLGGWHNNEWAGRWMQGPAGEERPPSATVPTQPRLACRPIKR